jgi:hypothetical protein
VLPAFAKASAGTASFLKDLLTYKEHMTLQKRFEHLKKSWLECLFLTVLFAGWLYSIGFIYQIIVAVVSIPLLFSFSDLLFSNRNNWLRKEGLVKSSNNIAVWLSIGTIYITLIASFFIAGYIIFDVFNISEIQYQYYYALAVLLIVFLFRSAYKE